MYSYSALIKIQGIMKKLYFLLLLFFCRALVLGQTLAPSPTQNFVRVESVLISGRTTDAQVLSLNDSQKSVSYQYSDGFGRNTQTVIWRGSPQKRDLIFPFVNGIGNTVPVEYLPYRSTATTGGFRSSAITEQATFYNNPGTGITSDSRPRRNNAYETSPLERILSSTEFGSGFETNGVQAELQVNIANQVRKWDIVSGLPRSTVFYPAGSLSVSVTKDASNFTTRTFSDWLGRKVLSQIQASATTWEDTYYVYNDYGQLLFVIPPAAATNLTPNQSVANLWYFCYEYDDFGRMTGSKAPGTEWLYTIYDRWDRPVLTQDGVQRAKSPQEWSFVKYDIHNRPIITGTFTSTATRASLTTAVANASTRDEIKNTSAVGYTLNRTYPTSVAESNLLTIEYYDDYHFLNISSWSPNNAQLGYGAETGFSGTRITTVKGLLTGTKTRRIGNANTWEHTVLHYDKYYQPLQVISNHQMNGRIKTVTQYAFSGEVEKSVNIYSYGSTTTRVQRRYTYDHAKRPVNVYHQVNNDTEVLLSRTVYNELGQPYEIIHHSRNNGTDWLYKSISKNTTQGWLDEIRYVYSNNAVVFSQKLDYDKSAGNSNSTRLDGLITSNKWQHYGSQPERAYTYIYNSPKRISGATYRQRSGSSWITNNFYNEENIVYSNNGNITSLRRNSDKSGASAQIDNLTYTYSGNRLMRVTDSAPTTHRADGFNDGFTSGDDYVYNQNGFVTIDRNKNITAVTYNILDRPTRVTFGSGVNIRYTYGSGGGLQTITYHNTSSGSATKTLQYVGELVFENGVLTDINHEYGRVLADNGFRYQYYLADYLGSTRVVLQEDPAVFTSSATFENNAAEEEEEQFIGYEEAVRISADFLNHTSGSESSYSMRLTGGYGENVGVAKSVSVMPGDTVRFEVYGKYIDIAEAKRNPAIMGVLMAIMGADPIGMGVDGGLNTSVNSLGSESGGLAGLLTSKKEMGDAPPAYLNYLFFDREMNYKYGGFVQMSNAAREDGSNVSHEKLSQQVVAEEPGYFYIYLSNDSQTGSEAFFDDFTIQTSESYIVQQIDYYPYGMVAREFRRLGDKHTNDLFQGKTYEDLTKWYDFHARQYDASLGRWFGVDPQNQFASPYLAMGNNPVMMVDPDGEWVHIAIGALIGGTMNWLANGAQFNSKGLGYFGVGALAGALGAGVGAGISSAMAGGSFGAGFVGSQAAMTATSSFLSGATIGAGSGFAGGFTSGMGNSLVSGQSFGSALNNGLKSGLLGSVSGFAIGGAFGELSALKSRNNTSLTKSSHQNLKLGEIKFDGPDYPVRKIGSIPAMESRGFLDEVVVTANYFDRALAFEGIPYLWGGMTCIGLDCSGLVHRATGHNQRIWDTNSNSYPPGNWANVSYNTTSPEAFIKNAVKGDLFVWKGHTAFSGGGDMLFHARRAGTRVGYTKDLLWWLKNKGYPNVFRQILR